MSHPVAVGAPRSADCVAIALAVKGVLRGGHGRMSSFQGSVLISKLNGSPPWALAWSFNGFRFPRCCYLRARQVRSWNYLSRARGTSPQDLYQHLLSLRTPSRVPRSARSARPLTMIRFLPPRSPLPFVQLCCILSKGLKITSPTTEHICELSHFFPRTGYRGGPSTGRCLRDAVPVTVSSKAKPFLAHNVAPIPSRTSSCTLLTINHYPL